MMLLDVNILIYAFRDDGVFHEPASRFLNDLANSGSNFGTPESCLCSLVRIVTQEAFKPSISLETVINFCSALQAVPTFMQVRPSENHWRIFQDLCLQTNAHGKAVADAYLATFALDRGDEWVTNDRDFSRYPGLRWRNPFSGQSVTNPR